MKATQDVKSVSGGAKTIDLAAELYMTGDG